MSKVRIAINGFGRIGRTTARAILHNDALELIAVNDLAEGATLAHLFKYDSVHGKFKGNIEVGENLIRINEKPVYLYSSKNPEDLPWSDLKIDVVIESTGIFRTKEAASKHISAGAKKVIISAPPQGEGVKIVVMGVNDKSLTGDETILSNASCTTNCVAPLVKVLDELWGIEIGHITTVHSYTSDQRLHDAPHSDMRRARAAAVSLIPTTTGAAEAIVKLFPHLEGKLNGYAIRVPVPDGSLTDFTCTLKRPVTKEEINAAFKNLAETEMTGILEYQNEPIVSVDIVGNSHSSIFDSLLTTVNGNTVKIVSWYDNEAGYSSRLADLAVKVG
ncbi:MAG: type I glyceraldehyde-3-phosphate dehydrogenase [Flavobacteriales bacterium]|nr:type I glyceraldehyde-3-phosphate dehydrogenase [Flavobacteriales bacterium]